MLAYETFLYVDQSSPDFFHGTREKSLSITFLSILHIWSRSGDIRDQIVKLQKNPAEYWTFFFALPNFRGRPSKSYTNVTTPASLHVVWKMFCGDTRTSPEVIVANMLNFKRNFKFSGLIFWGEIPVRVCAR